jgi:hypothetical protein
MRRKSHSGRHMGEALAAGVADRRARMQIEMYARTNNFTAGLEKLADRGVDLLIKSTQRTFGVAGALVLVLVAGIAVWVMGSFFGVAMTVRASRF